MSQPTHAILGLNWAFSFAEIRAKRDPLNCRNLFTGYDYVMDNGMVRNAKTMMMATAMSTMSEENEKSRQVFLVPVYFFIRRPAVPSKDFFFPFLADGLEIKFI